MRFHNVNEKFGPLNLSLREDVNNFLQEVWDEAVSTNRKDVVGINLIALKQLNALSLKQSAKNLLDHGLKLDLPQNATTVFDYKVSSIAIFSDKFADNNTHPLTIVFQNFALDGIGMRDIKVNFINLFENNVSFNVKEANQNAFHQWTSYFSIQNSQYNFPLGSFHHGWRLAIILDDKIIAQPILMSSLKNAACFSGMPNTYFKMMLD